MLLPDINIWLAPSFQSHKHHRLAATWFDQLNVADCAFCRMIQQGFLRLATLPAAFGDEARTMRQAWKLYDTLLADERVTFLIEPPEVEAAWRRFTNRPIVSSKIWNDAYLAAFALVGSCTLVTLNQAFVQFQGTPSVVLKG